MKIGKITSYVGPMFGGKTTRLLGTAKDEKVAKQFDQSRRFLIINSEKDNRYGENCIAAHTGEKLDAIALGHSYEIYQTYLQNSPLNSIYIDEAMFFDSGLVNVVRRIAHQGTDVYLAYLNLTSEGQPFPFKDRKDHVGALLAISDYVEKCNAISSITGERNATMTHYKHGEKTDPLLVGAKESYEAMSAEHWHPMNRHNIPEIKEPVAKMKVKKNKK